MSFDPITLAILSTVVGVAGAAVTTVSAINSANYQQQVATQQARVDNQNADRAEMVAQVNQQDRDGAAAAAIADETAQQGASGLSIGGTSQILTRKSAMQLSRQDALRIRQAGDLESYNDLVHSQASSDAAAAAGRDAGFSLLGGFLSGTGSLLGGYRDYLKVAPAAAQNYGSVSVPPPTLYGAY